MNGWNKDPEVWHDIRARWEDDKQESINTDDTAPESLCTACGCEIGKVCLGENAKFEKIYYCDKCIEDHTQEHDLTHEQAIEHIKTNINSKSKNHGFIRNYRDDIQPSKQSIHRSAS